MPPQPGPPYPAQYDQPVAPPPGTPVITPTQPPASYGPQPPAPQEQNPYDFIVNPPAAPKPNPMANLSMPKRLLFVGAIAVIILLAFMLVSNLLSSGKRELGTFYAAVITEQQQLISLTETALNERKVGGQAANFATTTNLALSSAQKEVLGYLKTNRIKTDTKLALATTSPTAAQKLKAAEATGEYEAVFADIAATELKEYRTALDNAYVKTSGKVGRDLLKQQFETAGLLQKDLERL